MPIIKPLKKQSSNLLILNSSSSNSEPGTDKVMSGDEDVKPSSKKAIKTNSKKAKMKYLEGKMSKEIEAFISSSNSCSQISSVKPSVVAPINNNNDSDSEYSENTRKKP